MKKPTKSNWRAASAGPREAGATQAGETCAESRKEGAARGTGAARRRAPAHLPPRNDSLPMT